MFIEFLDPLFGTVTQWLVSGIEGLPNFVVALIVVWIFSRLSRVVRNQAQKAAEKIEAPKLIENLFIVILRIAVFIAGIIIALSVLGLDQAAGSLLAGLGVMGLALGFALQDILGNFMSGILMAFQKHVNIGDLVEVGGTIGTVKNVSLRATTIETPHGQLVTMPNNNLMQDSVVNYTKNQKRRIDISCGVSYDDDLTKAQDIAVRVVESLAHRDQKEDVVFFYKEFGASSVDFTVGFWLAKGHDFFEARSAAIRLIKEAFDKEGITIPYTTYTLISDKNV